MQDIWQVENGLRVYKDRLFLTGEELTHVLDIKDLFVPERTQENENNNVLI